MANDTVTYVQNRFHLILGLMLLCPALACAAGLGKLKLSSALGEPLNADIELIDATPEELASIVARIGNKNEYAGAGLQDSVAPSGIRINVARNADGQSVLHLMSNRAIDDPFLELLIYMDSDTGHLARQYTLLLDPPVTKAVTIDESPTSTPTNTLPPASTAPLPRKEAKATTIRSTHISRPPVRHEKKAPLATDDNTTGYTVQPGDILGRVAQRYRPPGTSLHEAITAFHEANPDAFVNGDIDKLKVGQVLKVPAFDGAVAAPSQLDESKPAPEAKEKPAEPKQASANNNSGFVLHIGTEGMPDSGSAETKQSGASTATAAAKPDADKPNIGLPTAPTAAGPNTTSATESPLQPVAIQAAPAPSPQQLPAVASSTAAPAGDSLVDRVMWIGLGVFIALLGMLAMSFYKSRQPRVIRRY